MSTLLEKLKEYQASQPFQALAKKTQRSYQEAAVLYMACYKGEAEVLDVAERLDKFVEFCKRRNMGGTSIQLRLTQLKLFLSWALNCEIKFTYRIPRDEIKARKLRALRRWFSDAEIDKCLDYKFLWLADDAPIFRIMIRMFIETGMRLSEMMSIKWGHIKLHERTLLITDSKSEPRPAFFSPTTQEMLALWKKSKTVEPDKDEPVFPCQRKATEAIKQMLVDLGIKSDDDYRAAHTFRHYAATRMFYDGNMRIEDVAFLLGDEPNTIIHHYLHPTPRMLRKRVDEAMGWGTTKEEKELTEPQNVRDAREGLMKLGYKTKEIDSMLGRMTYLPEMTAEEVLQNALRVTG